MNKKVQLERNPLFNSEPAEEPKRTGRPRNPEIIREPGVKNGLRPGQTRVTFIMQEDSLKFVKDYAYTERITIREALDEIIRGYKWDLANTPGYELLDHNGPKREGPKVTSRKKENER